MPRPTKAFKRQRRNAAAEWKKGNRKEAYALWEQAAKGTKEHCEKKRNKSKAGGEAPPPPAEPTAGS